MLDANNLLSPACASTPLSSDAAVAAKPMVEMPNNVVDLVTRVKQETPDLAPENSCDCSVSSDSAAGQTAANTLETHADRAETANKTVSESFLNGKEMTRNSLMLQDSAERIGNASLADRGVTGPVLSKRTDAGPRAARVKPPCPSILQPDSPYEFTTDDSCRSPTDVPSENLTPRQRGVRRRADQRADDDTPPTSYEFTTENTCSTPASVPLNSLTSRPKAIGQGADLRDPEASPTAVPGDDAFL